MIRPLTCVCMILAGCAGLYLYQVKHQAQMLDREIDQTVTAVKAARERVRMLHAEWALLNEPERLQDLTVRHMPQLQPLAPSQFVQTAELGAHLPAVRTEPSAESAAAAKDAVQDGGEDAGDDGRVDAEMASPLPPHASPVARTEGGKPQIVAVQPQHIARLAAVAPSAPRGAPAHPHPHEHEFAALERPTLERAPLERHDLVAHAAVAPRPVALAAPRPVSAGVITAMAAPMRAAPAMRPVSSYEPVRAAMPLASPGFSNAGGSGVGSALGMARTMLPPPAPVAAYR